MKAIVILVMNEYILEALVDGVKYTVERTFDIKTVDTYNIKIKSNASIFGIKWLHKLFGNKRPLQHYATEDIILNFEKQDKYPLEEIPVNMLRLLYIELGVLKAGDCLLTLANHSEFKYSLVFRGPREWHDRVLVESRKDY